MVRRTKAEAEQTRCQIMDAARELFLARGVARSSLEQIAQVAGVTRGAVYWHFQNKDDLFFAMREAVTLPLIDSIDAVFAEESATDPLDGIQRALQCVLDLLKTNHRARQVFEIVRFRCEYVDEFAKVGQTLLLSKDAFRCQLEEAYRSAAAMGLLRVGLEPARAGYKRIHLWPHRPLPCRTGRRLGRYGIAIDRCTCSPAESVMGLQLNPDTCGAAPWAQRCSKARRNCA